MVGPEEVLSFWLDKVGPAGWYAQDDALDQEIRHCFDNAVALPADTAVNHPDSYLLKRYQTGDLVISASLKDKAALSQSLVFLRIDRP